ncbi:MAG: hypothetical protein WD137_12045 [Balneolaceae bacterium]
MSTVIFSIALFGFSELKAQTNSMPYNLAVIEAGYKVETNHNYVKRFESLLEKLDGKYEENEEEIGNISANVKKILEEEKGIEETLTNIMEGMNLVFSSTASVKYAEAVSSYIVLRDNGYNHDKAVDGLKNVLNSMNN